MNVDQQARDLRDYVPLTFTLPDGQQILVAMFLPTGIQPSNATVAVRYNNGFGDRWGPPTPPD